MLSLLEICKSYQQLACRKETALQITPDSLCYSGQAALQLLKPSLHDVDMSLGCLRLLDGLEHHETLTISRYIIRATARAGYKYGPSKSILGLPAEDATCYRSTPSMGCTLSRKGHAYFRSNPPLAQPIAVHYSPPSVKSKSGLTVADSGPGYDFSHSSLPPTRHSVRSAIIGDLSPWPLN
jgi:hypothetical protein